MQVGKKQKLMKDNKLIEFITKNIVVIINFSFIIFIVFWLLFFIPQKIETPVIDSDKLDIINEEIKSIKNSQNKLDSNMIFFSEKIDKIDSNILSIRDKRTIIERIQNEVNTTISNYSDDQIDSVFTNRYGYDIR